MTIDTTKLGEISPEAAEAYEYILNELQTFASAKVTITDKAMTAIAQAILDQQAKIERLEEENKELKGNQRPFTMPDIDGMTAKEDGTHRFRRRK